MPFFSVFPPACPIPPAYRVGFAADGIHSSEQTHPSAAPPSGVSLPHLPYNDDRRHLRLLLPVFTYGVGDAVHLFFPGVSQVHHLYNRNWGGGLKCCSNNPGLQPLSTKLTPEGSRLRGISISGAIPVRRPLPVVSFLSGGGWKHIRNQPVVTQSNRRPRPRSP